MTPPARGPFAHALSLDTIHVASPCSASWATMTGDDRVRHCQGCKLNVYNLSEMTRSEAEQLIAAHEGRMCVRFYRRADGTILTRDCPRGLRALTERVSRIAGALLFALIAVTPGFGQSPANSTPQNQAGSKEKDAQLGVDVTVMDPTNAVVQNARVVLCRCQGKITDDAVTDSTGVARFRGLSKGSYEVSVEAPGFKKSQQTVTIKKPEQLQVKLQIAAQTTAIEVKGGPAVVMGTATVGILAVIENPFPPVLMSPARHAPLR
jgi:carboxypeptidase family protein